MGHLQLRAGGDWLSGWGRRQGAVARPQGREPGGQAQGLSLDVTSPKELLLAPGWESEGHEGFRL